MSTPDPKRRLALVAGWRTPFCKVGTELRGASAADLAAHVFREVLDRTGFDPGAVDEVILGCAGPQANEANVARIAALRAGVPEEIPAVTVMRNCASGMEAIFAARTRLHAGEGEVFLVGGTESMSNFPLIMGPELTDWFQRLQKAKSLGARLKTMLRLRPRFLKPRVAVLEGLRDPITGLMMGNTAENVARLFGISRQQQDEFALRSHQNAEAAVEAGRLQDEIAPFVAPPRYESVLVEDNGIRRGQTMESLARLKPVFDRHNGDVTVGNACQVTDGAVGLLVMSEARARDLGLTPLAIVRGTGRAGLSPATMGLGPVHATPRALEEAGVGFSDLELFEINEAFAAQVLGCLQAFASDDYCRDEVGLSGALGEVDPELLNVNGGAIALGHPIAASGSRLCLTLAEEMQRRKAGLGLAALCVGGGQGQAVVLEAS